MALYPDQIRALLTDCETYLHHELGLEPFKTRVWNTAQAVVAYEERDLRKLLMSTEAELDSIQFTTDDDKIFDRTVDVVRNLQDALTANLAT